MSNPESRDTVRDNYLKLRESADRVLFELSQRYEKMLTFVSGGALILSTSFVEKIVPDPAPYTKPIAIFAWVSLATSLIVCLWSIAKSQEAVRSTVHLIDCHLTGGEHAAELQRIVLNKGDTVHALNRTSTVAATLGLAALVVFSAINYGNKETASRTATAPSEINSAQPTDHRRTSSDYIRPNPAAASSSTKEVTVRFEPTNETGKKNDSLQ